MVSGAGFLQLRSGQTLGDPNIIGLGFLSRCPWPSFLVLGAILTQVAHSLQRSFDAWVTVHGAGSGAVFSQLWSRVMKRAVPS